MANGRIILPAADPVFNAAGILSVGASLTVYLAGTTTAANLFANQGGTTPITNPQISNSAGLFYQQSTGIWADATQAYDCYLSLTTGENYVYLNIWPVGAPPVVSGFAPINSPVFTGQPQAPTPASNDSSSNIATTQFVSSAIVAYAFIPSGIMVPYGGSSAPSGWYFCDGTAYSRTTDAALYAAIGVTWGSGDGSTTFNVPDLRARYARGADPSGVRDPYNSVLGTYLDDMMQGHYHTTLGTQSGSPAGFSVWNTSSGSYRGAPSGSGSALDPSTGSAITDGTNGAPKLGKETRGKAAVTNWIIKR